MFYETVLKIMFVSFYVNFLEKRLKIKFIISAVLLFTYGFTGRDKGITHIHTHICFPLPLNSSLYVVIFDTCIRALMLPFGFVIPILINSP